MDINEAWKRTCKVLLGGEVGELEEYKNYLMKHVEPLDLRKSALSGKEVAVSLPGRFCKEAKFVGNDESEEYDNWLKRKTALGINDIKDLDSAILALGESLYYSGSIVLGNSSDVAGSDMCANANAVLDSHEVYDSKYVAYSYGVRYCECIFGSSTPGESNYCIKGFISRKALRCMEIVHTHLSSDCIYTSNMEGCTECMLSFNQRSKSHMIGNLQLSHEQYARLKSKLLEDIRDDLRSRKEVPTIFEIIRGNGNGKPQEMPLAQEKFPSEFAEIERSFESVTKVVLGKGLKPLMSYGGWLQSHVDPVVKVKSAVSNRPVYVGGWPFFKAMLNNVATLDESFELGKRSLPLRDIEGMDLRNASEKLAPIKCTTPELALGRHFGIVECAAYISSSYCFRNTSSVDSKYSAYSLWPRESEHVYGSSFLFSSKFCLKCYNSSCLTRCLEVNHSKSCSDCLFCHNCENLSDCAFCFNAKNLRYAIGNVEVGRERYLPIKKKMLDEIVKKLERGKRLDTSIYNVGCKPET